MAVLFYIKGKPVNASKAKDYINKAMGMAYNYERFTMDTVSLYWNTKAKSAEAREKLFDISAILPDGGLEIVIDSSN